MSSKDSEAAQEKPKPQDSSSEELHTTAELWRSTTTGEAADAADEVARGADQAAEQPEYGREGS